MTKNQNHADQEQMNSDSKANIQNSLNIKHDVADILKTIILLENAHGLSYLIKVLRGSDVEYLDEPHTLLETFGIMCGHQHDRIRIIVNYMIDKELLQPSVKTGNTIEITAAGRAYLDEPKDLFVSSGFLRSKKFDWELRKRLWGLRRDIANQAKVKPFKVYSELTVERLVRILPMDLNELKEIPGLNEQKISEWGHAILDAVSEIREKKKEASLTRLTETVKARTYQETKDLFNAGKTIEEISATKGVKEITVMNYLMRLHRTGQVDLKPWIEDKVDSKDLYKAVEFFRSAENPRMKVAHEVLKLPYSILRLAKIYSAEVATEVNAA